MRVFDGAANVRDRIAADVPASGTTVRWNAPAKGWNAGAVMAAASVNRWQAIRVGAGATANIHMTGAGARRGDGADCRRIHGGFGFGSPVDPGDDAVGAMIGIG